MSYQALAPFYDRYTADVNYTEYIEIVRGLVSSRDNPLLLDLACGTGTVTIELAKEGYDMIGLDISPDMLSSAWEKSAQQELNILWLNQDMTDFELYGSVKAITCFLDGINHITGKNDLNRLFRRVYNYLDPGGLFIFDLLDSSHFDAVAKEKIFCDEDEKSACIWKANFSKKTGICRYDVTFFSREAGNRFIRHVDSITERFWTIETILASANAAGLKLQKKYKRGFKNRFVLCLKK